MKVKKITFKKRFTRKVSSLAMAFMMVANLLGGYCAASEVSTKKVSAATTKQTQVPYRNVMYYGDWQFMQVRRILHLTKLMVV